MSVVIETTLGEITVDLFIKDRPRACLNFLKLCKIKYYNYNLFHTISRGFIAQTGDPTGSRSEGESIYGLLDGQQKRFFEGENEPRIKHTKMGLISFVGNEDRMVGSQFFLTLGEDLTYLDEKHCVFGEVVEGFDILEIINEVICDNDDRPYQDVRITHTIILDDPFPDPKKLVVPSRSPSPSSERLKGGRIAPDEDIDELEGKTPGEVAEMQAEREAKARATILEMVGDIPDADMAPPENVLFVCKLNPVTNDDDLEIIFSRFGKIKSCEVIRDKKTGDSLQYAFVEFEDKTACENAYFKMDNVLIDDRRIHVDFSQSVSKVKWRGKGRGVTHYDEKGRKSSHIDNDIGKGNYKYRKNDNSHGNRKEASKKTRERLRSPNRRNSPSYNREYSKKSKYNNRREKSTSISPERRYGYSKSVPNKDKHKISDRERYTSRSNRDKSKSPKRRKGDSPPPRRDRENGGAKSSSNYRKPSASPKSRDRDASERRRGKSLSPKSHDRDKSDKHNKNRASSSRKSSPKGKSHTDRKKYVSKGRKMTDSDTDSSGTYEKIEKYKRNESHSAKVSDKSKSKRSSNSKSRKRSVSRESDSEREGERKKRKNKKKKSRYSSSEDSGSESEEGVKKKDERMSSDSESVKSKSRKKKSVKKSKRNMSSDSDDYKKESKLKKKMYESDSD